MYDGYPLSFLHRSMRLSQSAATKVKTDETAKLAQPVKETVKVVKPAVTKAKTVELTKLAQAVKEATCSLFSD
jgi:hypothetical protein